MYTSPSTSPSPEPWGEEGPPAAAPHGACSPAPGTQRTRGPPSALPFQLWQPETSLLCSPPPPLPAPTSWSRPALPSLPPPVLALRVPRNLAETRNCSVGRQAGRQACTGGREPLSQGPGYGCAQSNPAEPDAFSRPSLAPPWGMQLNWGGRETLSRSRREGGTRHSAEAAAAAQQHRGSAAGCFRPARGGRTGGAARHVGQRGTLPAD